MTAVLRASSPAASTPSLRPAVVVVGDGAEGTHAPLGRAVAAARVAGREVVGFDPVAALGSTHDGTPQDVLDWFVAALLPERVLVVDLPEVTPTAAAAAVVHLTAESALSSLDDAAGATADGVATAATPHARLSATPRAPRVSLLVTMHDQERYVDQLIPSCLEQDYDDYEVVVVDDGSRDGSRAALAKYEGSPRLRVVDQPNVGRSGRIDLVCNRLAWESRGELLAYLAGDDVCEPDRLSAQVEAFDADPGLGLCHTGARQIDERGDLVREVFHLPTTYDQLSLPRILVQGNIIGAPSTMIRRDLFDGLNGFEDGIASDYQLWMRAALASRVRYLPRHLVRYRVHSRSLSNSATGHVRVRDDGVRCRERLVRRLSLRDLWPELPEESPHWADAALAMGNAMLRVDLDLAQHFYSLALDDPRARENLGLAVRLAQEGPGPATGPLAPRLPSPGLLPALEAARLGLGSTRAWDGSPVATTSAYLGLTGASPELVGLLLQRWAARTRSDNPVRLVLCTAGSSLEDLFGRVVEASGHLRLEDAADITLEVVDSLALVPAPVGGVRGEVSSEADVAAVDGWLAALEATTPRSARTAPHAGARS